MENDKKERNIFEENECSNEDSDGTNEICDEDRIEKVEEPSKKYIYYKKTIGGFFSGVIFTLIASAILVFFIAPRFHNSYIKKGGLEVYENLQDKIDLIEYLISKEYLYEPDEKEISDGICRGYLFGLIKDDPYAAYYSKKEWDAISEQDNGQYCGIGAVVSQNPLTKSVTVITVYPSSPAEKAGMKSGDILLDADGHEFAGEELDYIVKEYIRGEKGTKVNIKILRENTEGSIEELTLECVRDEINVPEVEYCNLKDIGLTEENEGYIKLFQFSTAGGRQFVEAANDLKASGIDKLVIDLRGNPGGDVEVACGLLDYFLLDNLGEYTDNNEEFKDGRTLLVYTRDKHDKGQAWYCEDGESWDIPISIIVDKNSASASELFTGCMRDYGRAEVIGETSFGKGIVQTVRVLADGSAIKFTTHHYYTPSGYSIHKKGIEPDYTMDIDENKKNMLEKNEGIDFPETLKSDLVLEKACEVLDK